MYDERRAVLVRMQARGPSPHASVQATARRLFGVGASNIAAVGQGAGRLPAAGRPGERISAGGRGGQEARRAQAGGRKRAGGWPPPHLAPFSTHTSPPCQAHSPCSPARRSPCIFPRPPTPVGRAASAQKAHTSRRDRHKYLGNAASAWRYPTT